MKIKLNRHKLGGADSCVWRRLEGQPVGPSVAYGSNKKTKPLLAGIGDPSSRESRLGKLDGKLSLHILFIVNICMNSGKQSNNNKALIFQAKPSFFNQNTLDQGLVNSFCKRLGSKYFQYYRWPGLCHSGKGAINNIKTNRHGFVPIKLYL